MKVAAQILCPGSLKPMPSSWEDYRHLGFITQVGGNAVNQALRISEGLR